MAVENVDPQGRYWPTFKVNECATVISYTNYATIFFETHHWDKLVEKLKTNFKNSKSAQSKYTLRKS